jgi:hypothetical protein
MKTGCTYACAMMAGVFTFAGAEATPMDCFDVKTTTMNYFPHAGSSINYPWLSRRLCLMAEPSLAQPGSERTIRCVSHDSFSSVLTSVRLSDKDCQLVRTDLNYSGRQSNILSRKVIALEGCGTFVGEVVGELVKELNKPAESTDAGFEVVKVDGAEWFFEWNDASGSHFGTADISPTGASSPAEVVCDQLLSRATPSTIGVP